MENRGAPPPKHVVILSTPADVSAREALAKYLQPLCEAGRITLWHEGDVAAGEDVLAVLRASVANAEAIVVLLSPDMLVDAERMSHLDLPQPSVKIVPVIQRSCLWRETACAAYDVLPEDHRPAAQHPDLGSVWDEVVTALDVTPLRVEWRGGASAPANPLMFVGPSKPGSNLPARRLFVDRAAERAAMDEGFDKHREEGIPRCVSIVGPGGVGKSSLALEYAYRVKPWYRGGTFWVRAGGEPVDVLLAFSAELRAMSPPSVRGVLARLPSNDANGIAAGVRLALQSKPDMSLLVLDGVEADWQSHVPSGKVHVIVTTRDQAFAVGEIIHVEPLQTGDAAILAKELAGPCEGPEQAALERVLTELGGLPLAIEMAARAVKRWAKTWVSYEAELAKHAAALLAERPKPTGERGAFAAIDLSIARCAEGTERALLESLAALPPGRAPVSWVEIGAGVQAAALETAQAWEALTETGLASKDKVTNEVSLHRLVRQRVADGTSQEARDARLSRIAQPLFFWLQRNVDNDKIAVVAPYRSHAETVLGALERRGEQAMWVDLACLLAHHLRGRGAAAEARVLAQQAVEKAERFDPPNEPVLARTLLELGAAHSQLGGMVSAAPSLERALAIYDAIPSPDELLIAAALSHLAPLRRDAGDLAGARAMYERSLAIHEKVLGPQHVDVAADLDKLASLSIHSADPAAARPLLERSLAITEKARGPKHPEVAVVLDKLALVHSADGDPAAARDLLERALAIAEEALGPNDAGTLVYVSNLGGAFHDLGDTVAARALLERAVGLAENLFGPDSPDVEPHRTRLMTLDLPLPPIRRGSVSS